MHPRHRTRSVATAVHPPHRIRSVATAVHPPHRVRAGMRLDDLPRVARLFPGQVSAVALIRDPKELADPVEDRNKAVRDFEHAVVVYQVRALAQALLPYANRPS